MSEVSARLGRAEEQRRTHRIDGHRSEGRVVKRDFPRSHLHRAAPSLSVPGLRSSDRRAARGATPRE
jgi:hypothetical protein